MVGFRLTPAAWLYSGGEAAAEAYQKPCWGLFISTERIEGIARDWRSRHTGE